MSEMAKLRLGSVMSPRSQIYYVITKNRISGTLSQAPILMTVVSLPFNQSPFVRMKRATEV